MCLFIRKERLTAIELTSCFFTTATAQGKQGKQVVKPSLHLIALRLVVLQIIIL